MRKSKIKSRLKWVYSDHPDTKQMVDSVHKNLKYFVGCFEKKGGNKKTYCNQIEQKSLNRLPVDPEYLYKWVKEENTLENSSNKAPFILWLGVCDYEGVSLKSFMFEDIEQLDILVGKIR